MLPSWEGSTGVNPPIGPFTIQIRKEHSTIFFVQPRGQCVRSKTKSTHGPRLFNRLDANLYLLASQENQGSTHVISPRKRSREAPCHWQNGISGETHNLFAQ
jgi:hypothetical protein